MSLDGKLQRISKVITNNKPIQNEWSCECGGTVYAAPRSHFAKCSGGEVRCTKCRREARKFNRGYTCGVGCRPYTDVTTT